jgi:hypothetical protein
MVCHVLCECRWGGRGGMTWILNDTTETGDPALGASSLESHQSIKELSLPYIDVCACITKNIPKQLTENESK